MFKSGLSLAALYLVYRIFLDKDTMYERNRFFILLSFLASLVFPLIIIKTSQPLDIQFFGKDLTGIIIDGNTDSSPLINNATNLQTWSSIILKVYLGGVVVFGIKFLAEALSLLFLIGRQKNKGNNIIKLKNHAASGFSAFGYVFIDSRLSETEAQDIIRHEQKHLERFHFFDILYIELIKIIQWFNPIIYLFDRSLRAVHEFQADEECLNSGIPVENYQGLMLNQVFRTSLFNASNSFSNPTLIKKRMIMMTRKRSKALANLKVLLVLPVVVLLLFTFSNCSEKLQMGPATGEINPPPPPPTPFAGQENLKILQETMMNGEAEPFIVVEEMPMFPGGDSALLNYVGRNTVYPKESRDQGIQGRVIVRFVIGADGMVSKVSVLKGVDPILDAEAIRVVSQLPQFKPGKQGGKEVPVWYMLPITFSLTGKGGEKLSPPPPPPPPFRVNEQNVNEPFVVVQEMPSFPGGDTALLRYISNNIRYPEEAKKENITGRVIVRFCVTETGTVDKVSVLKGVHPALDAEAVRVISSLPRFIPGKQGGVPVPVWYTAPVTFALPGTPQVVKPQSPDE